MTKSLIMAVLVAALTACSSSKDEPRLKPTQPMFHIYVVPPNMAQLPTHGTGGELRNVVELTQQKRFSDARRVMEALRARQPFASEGYHALTASMALEALLEGDMEGFHQHARELEESFGSTMRPPQEYVEVVALHRAATGKSLPVNTPARLRDWVAKHQPTQ